MDNSTLTPDLEQAAKYLNLLDSAAGSFCFQQLDDKKKKPARQVVHLSIDGLKQLQADALDGYGTFISVNEISSGKKRSKGNVGRIRAVYADDDIPRDEPRTDWALPPSFIVESSPGKYHYYWLIDGDADVDIVEGIKNSIATKYNTDWGGVAGANRILRVPGFPHQKKEPFMSKLIVDSSGPTYSVDVLVEHFGFKEVPTPKKGDFKGDDHVGIAIIEKFIDKNMFIRETSPGEYHVTCPWYKDHKEDNGPEDRRANFMLAGTGGFDHASFKCHHDHKKYVEEHGKKPGHHEVAELFGIDIDKVEFDNAVDEISEVMAQIIEQNQILEEKKVSGMFYDMDEALEDESETDWLIEGVIERGTVNFLYGESAVYKSFIVMNLGLSIATENPFCGRYTEQGAVFYIASEGEKGIKRRIRAWYDNYGKRGTFFPARKAINLANDKDIELLEKAIYEMAAKRNTAPELVIIDTLAQSAGGMSTMDNDDMSVMIAKLKALARKLGCAFLVVHHTGKDTSKGMRGAYALFADADGVFKAESSVKFKAEMACEKLKDDEETAPMGFVLEYVKLGVHSKTGKAYGSLVAVHDNFTPAEHYIKGLQDKVKYGSVKAEVLLVLFDRGGSMSKNAWRDISIEHLVRCRKYNEHTARNKTNNAMKSLVETKVVEENNGDVRCIETGFPEVKKDGVEEA